MEKNNKKTQKPLIEKAWSKFFKKDHEGAKTVFTNIINVEKNDEALYGKACACFKLKEFTNATELLNNYLQKNQKSFKGFHLRGMIKGEMNKYKEAVTDIEKSININPDYSDGYYDLGGCYLMTEEYQKAFDCFERCLTRDKSNAGAWFGKGLVALMNKEYSKAIEYFTIALKLDKKLLLAILGRCEAYYEIGQKKEAFQDFKKAKKLNPDIFDDKRYYNDDLYKDDDNNKKHENKDDNKTEIEDFRFDD